MEKLTKFRCSTCQYRKTHLESVSQYIHGVLLNIGQSYCTAGKKYRIFKKSDPKIYPPAWCPKRKWPCEYRIYAFKDVRSRCLHNLFSENRPPDEYRCAIRQAGVIELSPADFFSMLEERTATQLLGVNVNPGEIVEMDDGLKSYCFYLELSGAKYLPYWKTAKARQNVYQMDSEQDSGPAPQ